MSDPSRSRTVMVCALIAVATAMAYAPVRTHEFLNLDDDVYVTDNAHVRAGLTRAGVVWAAGATREANYWHPLTWVSHMLDVTWFGLEPGGHHVTSAVLHGVNAVVLCLVLQGLTGAVWRSGLVAGLFALHPLHVESVAWIAERKDVLSTLWALLALGAYGRYARDARDRRLKSEDWRLAEAEGGGGSRKVKESKSGSVEGAGSGAGWGWYGVAVGCFGLGLMSKPMVVTLPLVMLLMDWWPLGRVNTGVGKSKSRRVEKQGRRRAEESKSRRGGGAKG